MSRSPTAVIFGLAAAALAGALVIAAALDRRPTAFSLNVPNNLVAARLAPGKTLCQGPIAVAAPFSALNLWLRPATRTDFEILRLPGRRVLLHKLALTLSPARTGRVTIVLGRRAMGANQTGSIEICIRNRGAHELAFEGGQRSAISGQISIPGAPNGNAIAVVFLRAHAPSLLSLMPTVFRRASLFKLQFVGPWAFWALLAGVLVAAGLAGAALTAAVAEDGGRELESGE